MKPEGSEELTFNADKSKAVEHDDYLFEMNKRIYEMNRQQRSKRILEKISALHNKRKKARKLERQNRKRARK